VIPKFELLQLQLKMAKSSTATLRLAAMGIEICQGRKLKEFGFKDLNAKNPEIRKIPPVFATQKL